MLKAFIKRSFFSKIGNFDQFNGVIPKGVTVHGRIIIDGNQALVIEGDVNGDVITTHLDVPRNQSVVISGCVTGDVFGFDYILVNGGKIFGTVACRKTVALKNKGVIKGDLVYGELAIESGSVIEGKLTAYILPQPEEIKAVPVVLPFESVNK